MPNSQMTSEDYLRRARSTYCALMQGHRAEEHRVNGDILIEKTNTQMIYSGMFSDLIFARADVVGLDVFGRKSFMEMKADVIKRGMIGLVMEVVYSDRDGKYEGVGNEFITQISHWSSRPKSNAPKDPNMERLGEAHLALLSSKSSSVGGIVQELMDKAIAVKEVTGSYPKMELPSTCPSAVSPQFWTYDYIPESAPYNFTPAEKVGFYIDRIRVSVLVSSGNSNSNDASASGGCASSSSSSSSSVSAGPVPASGEPGPMGCHQTHIGRVCEVLLPCSLSGPLRFKDPAADVEPNNNVGGWDVTGCTSSCSSSASGGMATASACRGDIVNENKPSPPRNSQSKPSHGPCCP